ncbi:MAG: preprotein translocase subunit SecY [Candidatus Omnitrophota bacterium]|nr:MAG: preprotein translocase subunit SecY [Candidatus Omnitrophota bacterium]RKY45135.1 MAG: preprotein translocase subunit SecY [Candidatus Omnitrophota bacterium]
MFTKLTNIFRVEELRKKVLVTLSLLIVYRIGCFIPTPGIDGQALSNFFEQLSKIQGQTILGIINLFTGGALRRLSIFALGIMPYISASIIMQLLTGIVPALENIAREGRAGYEKINQYTRYLTLFICLIQGFMLALWLENPQNFRGVVIVPNPGALFRFVTVFTLTCGTIFIMWLGEQIQERGIGNGISLIITTSIISRIPSALYQLWMLYSPFDPSKRQISTITVVSLMVLWFLVVLAVVLFTQAQRRIPIQYGKRIIGRRVYGGQSTYLPIRVDMAGVIAIIFAQSVILFPGTIATFFPKSTRLATFFQTIFRQGGLWYNLIYIALIMFFMYFYTAIVFNPQEIANNLKKYGGFIPGIRPGRQTAEHLDYVVTRIVFIGAIYVAVIAILPGVIMKLFNIPSYAITSFFGGTTILIMVGVVLDTMRQIEGQLLIRYYDGFIKGKELKGRR